MRGSRRLRTLASLRRVSEQTGCTPGIGGLCLVRASIQSVTGSRGGAARVSIREDLPRRDPPVASRLSAPHLPMRRLACLALVAVCALPAAAQAPDPLAAFAASLDSLRQAHPTPGLAVAVVRPDAPVWARGFGVADADEAVPVSPDTPFWIASVTKTFVGLTFLGLEAEGVVDLDAPLAALPEFTDFCAWLAGSPLPFGRGLDCAAALTARTLLTHTSNGDVGHAFLYNPLLYSRLPRFLEWTVHGSTEIEGGTNELARQVEARILGPAGMTRTVASQWDRAKMDVVYDMARGYGIEDGAYVLRPTPKRALTGGAGIVSTVLDLARYVQALDAGTLAPPSVMAQLTTPPLDRSGAPLPYSYGWYVQDIEGERVVWHAGWDEEAGASALLLRVPARGLALVLLANGEGLHWGNPLDGAAVEASPHARAFLEHVVFAEGR